MQKEELWILVVKKQPQFGGEAKVTLTPAGLRRLFDLAWERGHEAGFANGRAWEQNQAAMRRPTVPPSIFDQVFGKGGGFTP